MWQTVSKANLGVLAALNDVLCTLQQEKPFLFPDLGDDVAILAASDYSGQHSGASYEVYSFVFTSPSRWRSWEQHRREIRGSFLFTRRISFKTLNDRERWKVLPFFLGAAALLEGVTMTVLVNKAIRSLFFFGDALDLSRPELAIVSHWKAHVVEKLLRVTHLMGLFLAGISREGQDFVWISDEDDIASNRGRVGDVAKIIGNIFSNLSDHSLRHVRFGTTASDDGTSQLEDLTAIADLSAGATIEVLTDLQSTGTVTIPGLVVPASPRISRKTRALFAWLTDTTLPHRHITIAVEPGLQKGQLDIRRIVFDTVRT